MMIPEERSFPAAEAVERHGNRNGNVDANHACLHIVIEPARRVAIARENRNAIAELVSVYEVKRLLRSLGSHKREDGAKDLFAIHSHSSG